MFATITFLVLYLAIPINLAIAALFGLWSKGEQEPLAVVRIPSRQDPRRWGSR
jgi:hypothetical protein